MTLSDSDTDDLVAEIRQFARNAPDATIGGRSVQFTYDSSGRIVKMDISGIGSVLLRYDSQGQLIELATPEGISEKEIFTLLRQE